MDPETLRRTFRWTRTGIDVAASLAVIVAALFFVRTRFVESERSQDPPAPPRLEIPSEPLPLDGAALLGRREARIGIVAFSDFQCPFCEKFARETLPTLVSDYIDSGKVLFGLRHFPIERIHPFAPTAAAAAVCAGLQGKFWSMHDRLFERYKQLNESYLAEQARALALDKTHFDRCLGDGGQRQVREDAEAAAKLRIRGTPAFFLGTMTGDGRLRVTTVVPGARPVGEFKTVIESLLATVGG